MVILRCTQKLRQRLPATAPPDTASTTVLGDWTCHLVRFGRIQVILCVSHVTLLPVLLPARPAQTLPARLPPAVGRLLAALAVPPEQIAAELTHMVEFAITPTNNRRVLGSLNDFNYLTDHYVTSAEPDHLPAVSRHLADTPCKPIDYLSPERAVAAAFAAQRQT